MNKKRIGKYQKLEDGEWYQQPWRDRTCCCDCGLVHDVETRIIMDPKPGDTILSSMKVQQRHHRNARATAQVRRAMIRKGEL